MKRIFTLAFLLLTTFTSTTIVAQVNIGTGTLTNTTTGAAPINIWYRSMHYQVVYTAAELMANGAVSGDAISELGWYVTGVPINSLPNYTIKIKNTTATNALVYDGVGLTTCVVIPSHTPTSGGFDMVPFTTNFVWNGVSNLLIDVCFDQVTNYNGSGQVRIINGASGDARYIRSDGSPQCGVATNANLSQRPQVSLTMAGGVPPTCPMPSNATIANLTATSVDFNWTTGGAFAWLIEYGPSGFTPGTGTLTSLLPANTFNIPTLNPATSYDWYVADFCGPGDTSFFLGPNSFTTPCATFVAPYLQDFDAVLADPICWSSTGLDPWRYRNSLAGGGFPSPGYGVQNSIDHTSGTGNFAWIDASGNITSNELITATIDMSALTTPYVGFWVLSNNTNDVAQNSIELSAWDGAAWVLLTSYSGNDPDWKFVASTLPATIPTTTYFKLEQKNSTAGGNAFFNDLLVDDFFVVEAPTCFIPTNITVGVTTTSSVELSWTTGGSAAWLVEYGPVGFPQGQGTLINANSNPFTITGLPSSTEFDFYVADYCTPGDTSWWSSSNYFATDCDTVIAPYAQNFDVALTDPYCWTSAGTEPWRYRNSGGTGFPSPGYGVQNSVDHTTGTGNFAWIDASGGIGSNELISPVIDFSGLTQGIVGCWVLSNNTQATNPEQNLIHIEAFNGTTWDSITTYSGNSAGWIRFYAIIPASIPTITSFRLVQEEGNVGGSAFFNDVLIDDFFVEEAPTCFNPTNLSDSILTPTTVELSWTTGGATDWIIEYGPTGFIPGTGAGTLVNTNQNPFVLTVNSGTDYDWYVQDSCSATDISWHSYQNDFRMPGEVVCSDSSTNFTYCYANNEDEIYTYQSDNGSSFLHIVFNAGQIGFNDDFVIYDGPDATYPILFSTTGNVNMTAMEFTSTGPIVAFAFNTFGFPNNACTTPLDFDINCCEITTFTANVNVCQDSTYTLADGIVVSSGGAYYATIPNMKGCDSIITYIITYLEDSVDVSDIICSGSSYTLPDGTTTTTPGFFQQTIPNSLGCDSTINLTLTLAMPTNSAGNASICDGDTYEMPDGTFVNTAGFHTILYTNAAGCDSTYALNLSLNPLTAETQSATICSGESYTLPDGVVVNTSGSFTSNVLNLNGCNHTITTNLIVAVSTFTQDTVELCGEETYLLLDGEIVTAAGEYNVNVGNSNGCDSIVTIYVSRCIVSGIDGIDGKAILSIHPNPTNSNINVSFNTNIVTTTVNVQIMNALGQEIYSIENVSDKVLAVDVSTYAEGIYYIVVKDELNTSVRKFIVTK